MTNNITMGPVGLAVLEFITLLEDGKSSYKAREQYAVVMERMETPVAGLMRKHQGFTLDHAWTIVLTNALFQVMRFTTRPDILERANALHEYLELNPRRAVNPRQLSTRRAATRPNRGGRKPCTQPALGLVS